MRFFALIFIACLFCSFANPASAQSISLVQELDYGEAVVKDNDSQHSLIVNASGGVSADAEFAVIVSPQEGVYRLTGATAFQPISSVIVTVDQQVLNAGEQFIIDNFDIDFPATADINGEAIISVGARLRTSGTGTPYTGSTTFNGFLTLAVTLL